MKYYSITSTSKQRSTNEVVGSSGFMVMVKSEDDVKKVIQAEMDNQDPNEDTYEDEFFYRECSKEEYKTYQEENLLRTARSYYNTRLINDEAKTKPIREIWEALYNTDNDVMATKYFLDMLSAVEIIKRKSNLDKMTAKEFLDRIHKLASSSSEDYSKNLAAIIKA